MRKFLTVLALIACSSVNAANVTIADFSKTYEHQFTNCVVNLHNTEFFYAVCEKYAAPFISASETYDTIPIVYDEIGINGVYWHGCVIAGDPLLSIRFECNVPASQMEFEVVDQFGNTVQDWFRFYRPYYGPYTR